MRINARKLQTPYILEDNWAPTVHEYPDETEGGEDKGNSMADTQDGSEPQREDDNDVGT